MSITDASTNVSTTWTEQDTVAFTSGTLGDIADCVTEVESKIRRGILAAHSVPSLTDCKRWLIRAKQEICELRNYTWARRYAYVDTVSGTFRYALPPDYNGGQVSLRDLSNDHSIPIWTEYWFDSRYPDPAGESSNTPEVAAIKGNELWLIPPPNGVYRLELDYTRSGDDNTQEDFSYLPQIERYRCCDYATAESFESLHQFDKAQYYMQKWVQGLGKSRHADARRKWKRMRYQAISQFQEQSMMGHQLNPEDY